MAAPQLDLDRYPISFGAFLSDQWKNWAELFPAEQNYFTRLLGWLDGQPLSFFDGLREIEKLMGVNGSNWPKGRFTLEQVDFLNRNAHYKEWRAEVARIFSIVDPAIEAESRRRGRPRLVIVASPADLPVGPDRMWKRIEQLGKRRKLEPSEDPVLTLPRLLGKPKTGLLDRTSAKHGAYAAWAIETGATLASTSTDAAAVRISYERLTAYRGRLMAEVQRITEVEKIQGPRQLSARLKMLHLAAKESELAADPVLSEYLRSVLLAGNGTLLVNNTFVEWATVQAIRRARPTLTAVAFGIRNKIKPFSSLLIYSDQDRSNVIPTQADMLGSYVDLELLYQYVWREPVKYAEYQNNTVMLFLGEGMDEALVIAPPDFAIWPEPERLTLEDLGQRLGEWLQV